MIKLNTLYKPLKSESAQIQIENKNKYKKVESNFNQQFINARQKLERTEEEKLAAIKEQSLELETELVKIMVSQMFKTIEKSGFIDGGQGEELFKGMLHDEYSSSLVKNSNFGLADSIYNQVTGKFYR
ncbi:rod-binding protein [Candidatus Dependentiae bacterium]|nr:rod-binding protein [Candidatus Dependentiae bacterium]